MNAVCPMRLDVSDEETPVHIFLVLQRGPFEFLPPSTHGATCLYFGVIMHMCGGECLACKVSDSIKDLVVTRRDEVHLFVFKGVADVKCCATSIATILCCLIE